MRSPTNRCMYCGEALHESHRMSQEEVKARLAGIHAPKDEHAEFLTGMSGKLPHQLEAEAAKKQKKKKKGLMSLFLRPFTGSGDN